MADVAERVGLDRPPALALDEWNVRHLEPADWPEPQPSADGAVEPRELAVSGGTPRRVRLDLVASGVLIWPR